MRDQGARLVGVLRDDVQRLGEVRAAAGRRAVDDGAGELNLVQQQVEGVDRHARRREHAQHRDAPPRAHRAHGVGQGVGLAADRLEDDVDRLLPAQLLEPRQARLVGGDDLVGAEAAGGFGLMVVAGGDQHRGAGGAQGEDAGQADVAGAQHEDRLAGPDVHQVDGVDRAGHRLGERGDLRVDARRGGVGGVGGDQHELGHAARMTLAQDGEGRPAALHVPAGAAAVALLAADDGLDAHDIALTQAIDAGPDGRHDAAVLMPRAAAGGGVGVAVAVQVAAADAGRAHRQDDLAGARRGCVLLDDFEVGGGGPDGGSHAGLLARPGRGPARP